MKNIDIGFDIGISSVGWALVDSQTSKIILHGSRLFSTVDNPKDSKLLNEKRRESRSARRQVNRRYTLKRDFIKWLIKSKYVSDIKLDNKDFFVSNFLHNYINIENKVQWDDSSLKNLSSVFYFRNKGLQEKLDKNSLIKVLYWYILHRGFKYTVADENEEDIAINEKDIFPITQQINYFKENGYLNGEFNRRFHQDDYLKEIDQIFLHQKLGESFKKKFLSFFTRQRSFEDGPGNYKTNTKYGVGKENYVWDSKLNRSKPTIPIWSKTIGKCSLYPDENRAPKKAPTSELFNLINDLVNLRVNGSNLNEEVIRKCIDFSFATKSNLNKIMKYISETLNVSIDDIEGFRIDKSGKNLITSLVSFHLISKALLFETKNLKFVLEDFLKDNRFDSIADVLSNTKTIEKRKEEFKNIFKEYKIDKSKIDNVSKIKENMSQRHSFSYKAMRSMLQTLVIESINQQQYIYKYHQPDSENAPKTDLNAWLHNLVATPTVKRSLRQTIKVLNALVVKCQENDYKIQNIVVEMARETKNKQARENETQRQKFREANNKEIAGYINSDKNIPSSGGNSRLREKIWFWKQQMGKDVYDGIDIKLEHLKKNPHSYDVDHIIPRSQSFDNSRENKVLTKNQHNARKNNLTPIKYINNNEKFEQLKSLWNKWYLTRGEDKSFLSKQKFNFLTTTLDMTRPENQIGFIARNLVDTRYTTKEFLKYLNSYKDDNNLDFKVKTINGKMTSFARQTIFKSNYELKRPDGADAMTTNKEGKITKERLWHGHHAEDAYLITILNKNYRENKMIEKILSSPNKFQKNNKYDNLKLDKKDALINTEYASLISSISCGAEELNNKMSKMKFSRMKQRRRSFALFDETVYSSKIVVEKDKKNKEATILKKIKTINLFDKNKKSSDYAPYFDEEHKDYDKKSKSLFIYDDIYQQAKNKEKTLYYDLKKIFFSYQNEKQPFISAYEEAKKTGLSFGKLNYLNFPKKLRLLGPSKNVDEIIMLPNNANKSFYESMNWFEIRIYKDVKNNKKVIPINATNAKIINNKIIIDSQKLFKWLERKNVKDPNNFSVLDYGDVISNDVDWYWVCGHHHATNRIELKNLSMNKSNSENQNYITLSSLIDFKIFKLDILGFIIQKSEI
ncbi:type II CRISPR RNA-guided endonuclease Cas9 [Candidatus Mycoplasma mahonii]|uniref:type II CRISPR RNA-guided endonuclease Cas9 n=1 Tax=Candidatus Mycoplasma mahonii TaxID=3004105 RepID=UPI0026EA4B0B|nr:type II CRISPR RNA-guided endonuclease Cas9 [Candidatus Mycoplasma mahonii]WKX02398.1 type II CRISPR RNA-guided endonuclease Cas9 [Candidatus Mycoplasma mahonii]